MKNILLPVTRSIEAAFLKSAIKKGKTRCTLPKNPHCGHVMTQNDKGIYSCQDGGCAQWGVEYQENDLNDQGTQPGGASKG